MSRGENSAMIMKYIDPKAHSTEFYDSRERDSKAKWHYDRAGKMRGASLKKGIENDYQSELLKRGVKNSSGEHKDLERKEDTHKQQPMHFTKVLNVGDKDENVKTGFGVHAANGFAFRE